MRDGCSNIVYTLIVYTYVWTQARACASALTNEKKSKSFFFFGSTSISFMVAALLLLNDKQICAINGIEWMWVRVCVFCFYQLFFCHYGNNRWNRMVRLYDISLMQLIRWIKFSMLLQLTCTLSKIVTASTCDRATLHFARNILKNNQCDPTVGRDWSVFNDLILLSALLII